MATMLQKLLPIWRGTTPIAVLAGIGVGIAGLWHGDGLSAVWFGILFMAIPMLVVTTGAAFGIAIWSISRRLF
jgi:hypothetical protein